MDFILLDIGAGIQENVLSLHHPSFESLVMLTPEPTSLTDAYGLIKLLRRHSGISNAGVIVNQVTDGREGQLAFQRLRDVSAKFIDVKLDYMGHWNRDEKITQSVMKRKILLDWNSGSVSPAVASLELIAKRLRSKLLGKYLASSDDKNGQTRFLWGNRIRSSQPLTTGEQSGNTAGFFRTLLTGSSGSFLKR
jgi:flagellar biosynthesis protein FlhG